MLWMIMEVFLYWLSSISSYGDCSWCIAVMDDVARYVNRMFDSYSLDVYNEFVYRGWLYGLFFHTNYSNVLIWSIKVCANYERKLIDYTRRNEIIRFLCVFFSSAWFPPFRWEYSTFENDIFLLLVIIVLDYIKSFHF